MVLTAEPEAASPPLAQSLVPTRAYLTQSWEYSRAQLYADLCEAKLDRLFNMGRDTGGGVAIGDLLYKPRGVDSGHSYWDLYVDFLHEIKRLSGCPGTATWYKAPRLYDTMPSEDVWHVAHAACIEPYEMFVKRLKAVDLCRHSFDLIVKARLRCRNCGY